MSDEMHIGMPSGGHGPQAQPADHVIEHLLGKADMDGELGQQLEDRLHELAESWGYRIEDDESSAHYGAMQLPDGRYVDMSIRISFSDGPFNAVDSAITRMRAWAEKHGEADTQGLVDDEWENLARAALGFPIEEEDA